MAGRMNSNFLNDFLEYIKVNDCNISDLSKKCKDFIIEYVSDNETYEDAKCAVYIGSCENANPKLAFIEVKKANLPKYRFEFMEPSQVNSFVPGFAGSIKVPDDNDLSEAFVTRLQNNCLNKNLICVKKAARAYLENAAARYPDTCNQNIQFKVLR